MEYLDIEGLINFVSGEMLINISFGYNEFNCSICCLAIDKITIFAKIFFY